MTSLIHPSDSATEKLTRTYRDHQRPLWQRALLNRDVAVWAALVAVFLYASATVPFFDRPITITYLLLDVAPILLIALPMTLVIITGEIDLSVASTVALASVSFGVLYDKGTPILLAAVAALLVGLVCGAFNGFLVTALGLPSLAVTIGTLALYRGIAVGLLGTTAITDFPDTWTDWARGRIGDSDIPSIMIPFAVLAVLFIVLLHFTAFGRGVYAIGLNEGAARFSGIRVERTKLLLFVLTGVVSALAGIYYTLRYGSARGDNANGMEMQVIAAVLLGGVSIFGGRGALPGVIAGVLLIGAIGSALRLADQTADVINIVTGLLLVVAVVGSSVLGWVSSKRRRRGAPEPRSSTTPPGTPTPGTTKADTDVPVGERKREDR
ncbi:ABC transporter permease [Mumia zhuanghuii]|uniref:Autoinducer 2 import system permease protein LsrD n=1 Tax=Mumia zhuanghuii TaxID=2585211 RepID=A0A5C4MUN9_9ACTN|nr:ABC transporter permease [Mumia zhuanghuii]TNC36574.1 ABC transporter permease [Mumia zhuanghuii]TNC48663.1 ABC transporter permease [Mumia zhuanghuii]